MCGSYTLVSDEELDYRFGVTGLSAFPSTYNARPTQQLPVITQSEGQRMMEIMRWGFLPVWAKDTKRAVINARVESLVEKPYFKGAVKRHRCLIPASGFYEWQQRETGKQPYLFTLKNQHHFAMAGIYSIWESPDGSVVPTYAIITGKPNATVKPIHDRMPLVLEEDEEEVWLSNDEQAARIIADVVSVYPASKMTGYPVSSLVNNPKNNAPELIAPLNSV